jgi:hypothetical protein
MKHPLLTLTFIAATWFAPMLQQSAKAQVPGGLMLPTPPAAMQSTPDSVYILQNGLLAKFDAKTLKLLSGVRLMEPIPPAPTTDDPTDRIRYFQEVSRHLVPAALISHPRGLIVILSDELLRIDPQKLTIDSRVQLVPAMNNQPRAPQFSDLFQPQRPPVYQISGDILYLMRSGEIVAVDLATGTISARTVLPAEMQAQPTATNPVGPAEQD